MLLCRCGKTRAQALQFVILGYFLVILTCLVILSLWRSIHKFKVWIFRYAQNDRTFVILSLWRSIQKFKVWICIVKAWIFRYAQNDKFLVI